MAIVMVKNTERGPRVSVRDPVANPVTGLMPGIIMTHRPMIPPRRCGGASSWTRVLASASRQIDDSPIKIVPAKASAGTGASPVSSVAAPVPSAARAIRGPRSFPASRAASSAPGKAPIPRQATRIP
jgi:hypothetical protein